MNNLSAATKAECANARKEVVATAKMEVDKARAECKFAASKVVEDITSDFLEDIVALQYRCNNISDTVWSLQTPPEWCFPSFRLTHMPDKLKWTTLVECNNDLALFTQLFTRKCSVQFAQ